MANPPSNNPAASFPKWKTSPHGLNTGSAQEPRGGGNRVVPSRARLIRYCDRVRGTTRSECRRVRVGRQPRANHARLPHDTTQDADEDDRQEGKAGRLRWPRARTAPRSAWPGGHAGRGCTGEKSTRMERALEVTGKFWVLLPHDTHATRQSSSNSARKLLSLESRFPPAQKPRTA
jgi:hypothetical protein